MKKIKKIIAFGLVSALSVSIGIAGTMAYLTSQDSNTNVMTLGNVKIDQIEQEWNAEQTELQNFTQDKPLLPYVGDLGWENTSEDGGAYRRFTMNNVVDKYVSVKNTGKSDAYVRTIIALEMGDYTSEDFNDVGISINIYDGSEFDFEGTWDWNESFVTSIGGKNYYVMEAVHQNPLKSGETTIPSLNQVYLSKEATNETVTKLDGNKNGKYDILVLSQAVQAEGFENASLALEEAFGSVRKHASEWFADMPTEMNGFAVSNSDELSEAIKAGETELLLSAGIYQIPDSAKGKNLTISGASKDVVIEVTPEGQGEANGQLDYSLDGSTVTFNNVTIETNSQLYAGFARLSAVYNNCIINNTYNLGVGTSEFNNCEFNITNEYLRVGGAYSATFNNCTFNTDGRAILIFQDGTTNDQVVTVKDCTFNATASAKTWDGIRVAAVSYDGSQGGTYTVNFEGTNTVDEDFNGLWQIKKGEANVTVNGLDS